MSGITYILVSHSQHEVFSFKIYLADPWPEVVANLINGNIEDEAINHSATLCANLLPIFQNDNAAWCQTEEVFDVVLSLKKFSSNASMNSLSDDRVGQEQWL